MDDTTTAEAPASANEQLRPEKSAPVGDNHNWPEDTVATMCQMLAQGETGTAIAETIGLSRGAVRGKIASMERKGDPRLPAQRPRRGGVKVQQRTTAEHMNALADLMADGVATIVFAARLLGVSQSRADQLWQRIRRELGPQAR